MRKAILLCLLIACTIEPAADEVHTYRDAAEEVAMGQCSRWIECGTETEKDWRTCVNDLVWDFCNNLLDHFEGVSCASEYDRNFDEAASCGEWYAQVACTTYVEPCWI